MIDIYDGLPKEITYKYLYLEGLINEFIPHVQSERKRLDVPWKDDIILEVYTDDEHLVNAFYIFASKVIYRCKSKLFKPCMSKDDLFVEVSLEGKGPSDIIHKVAFKVRHV